MSEHALRAVALAGAALQCWFAYKEAYGWEPKFVEKVAPAWMKYLPKKDWRESSPEGKLIEETKDHVRWAGKLAFNMGAYNFVLAIGLAWLLIAGADVAASLGVFLGIWLLVAAAAAYRTEVYPAFKAQGLLGLTLLGASIWAW